VKFRTTEPVVKTDIVEADLLREHEECRVVLRGDLSRIETTHLL
jgi:hypothetical protein